MQKLVLFQGDSITDCGRNREDLTSTGTSYAHMVTGQLGCEGKLTIINTENNRQVNIKSITIEDVLAVS